MFLTQLDLVTQILITGGITVFSLLFVNWLIWWMTIVKGWIRKI